MHTRSQSRNLHNQQHQAPPPVVEPFNLEEPFENPPPPPPPMDDQRTMAQLLEAPTEGYEDAIVVPEINANFELKHGLINLVQNKQFFGHDKEDPHAHIRYFNKITSTMKFPNVPSTSVKLMLFPFSLEGAARIWLEKEPPRSIQTWDDLVSKFINKFFPPSKTTNLRNEITRFQQRFDETFYEAWDRFNDLLRACPHHGFSELHQLDTFYNALNSNDQDSPKSVIHATKPVDAKVSASTSTPGISSEVAELKEMVKALLLDKKNQSPAPTPVKAVEQSCVTCGGAHSYQTCPATSGNVYRDNIQEYVSQAAAANFNQGNTGYRGQISNQIRPPGFPPVQNHHVQNQGNNQNRYNQNRGNFNQAPAYQPPVHHFTCPQGTNHPPTQPPRSKSIDHQFVASNTASTSGTLPGNTVTNPKEDLKGITTRSGVAYKGPTIPITSSPPKVMERDTEAKPKSINSIYHQEEMKRRREKAITTKLRNSYEIFRRIRVSKLAIADALIAQPKFASTLKTLIGNKEKLSEMARTPLNENCSAVILNKLPKKLGDPGRFLIPCEFSGINTCNALADLGASINLMPYSVWKTLSLSELTPTCMTLELADRSISEPIGIAEDVYVTVGKFQFPADFVVVDFEPDPRVPLILGRSFLKTSRALIDVYEGEITLRVGKEAITFNLDQTSRYTADYNHMTANRIDHNDMLYVKNTLRKFLVLSDVTHDFLLFEEADSFLALEDDPTSPEVDPTYYDPEGDILILEAILNSEPLPPLQGNYFPDNRKDLKICEANREILRQLAPAMELNPWVSPVHCVPKKGGMTVVKNDDNDLIPTRLVTGWRVCIDYRKLNEATRKDHFPLPFMDQMLERLAGNQFYCFLDGFSGYFQIPIDPKDQEKTTFTCPYGTFAYRRMPFGLCNAPGTFQRCMMAIFHDMIEKTMEVFMDDFSVFGDSFSTCLTHLDKMLKRCEDTNLVLNWEKSHFMVKEGIVLGHKISKSGIEVDRAKVDIIAKLPHPTTVQ
ncbi:reverse transcriptase domain-containing protein [Tanacetum coccineum]